MMSLTGFPDEEGGQPIKAGVGIADVMCGMYATVSILAALNHRHETGEGQHLDISLFDTQVSWLVNQGVAHLVSGDIPGRLGNGHPTIVPYETFPGRDRQFILAVGNDSQFARFCEIAGKPEIARDPRFETNANRVRNRKTLVPILRELTITRNADEWIGALETAGIPCGPVNDLGAVFSDPHVLARDLKIALPHPASGSVNLIGSPIKMEKTPVSYRNAPPLLGSGTSNVLQKYLGLSNADLAQLHASGIIEANDQQKAE